MKKEFIFILLFYSFRVVGCGCEPENLYLEFDKNDIVFTGRVVSINDKENPDPYLATANKEYYKTGGYDVRIQIIDNFKGTRKLQSLRLVHPKSATQTCKHFFKLKEEYLFFGRSINDSTVEFNTCSRSGLLAQKSKEAQGIKEILADNYAPFILEVVKQLAPADSLADFATLKLLNSDSVVLREVHLPYLFKQNFILQEVSNFNLKNVFRILIYKTEFDECPSSVYQSLFLITYDGYIIELANYYIEADEEIESLEEKDPPKFFIKSKRQYRTIAFSDDIYSNQISGSLDPDFTPYTNNDYQMFVIDGNSLIGVSWNGYELKKTTLKSIEEHE